MHFIAVLLCKPNDPRNRINERMVADLLYRLSGDDDRVEHIRVRLYPEECRIGMLLLVDDLGNAERNASRLCLRAIRTSPLLAGWRLIGTTT